MITQIESKSMRWRQQGISIEDIQWLIKFYFNQEKPLSLVSAGIENARRYWRKEKDNVIEELEKWWEGDRGRFVLIEVDTRYGASDWEVQLGNVDRTFDPNDGYYQPDEDRPNFGIVCAAEAGYDGWPNPNVVSARTPNKEWTGLAPVIKAAIKRANDLEL